jgi:hypothetical protein
MSRIKRWCLAGEFRWLGMIYRDSTELLLKFGQIRRRNTIGNDKDRIVHPFNVERRVNSSGWAYGR